MCKIARPIIIFSDECTFKDVTIRSNDVKVVNCCEVATTVAEIFLQTEADLLTQIEIDNIYNKLFPYTQTRLEEREQHANNIQKEKWRRREL